MQNIFVITGQTAAGKTSYALELAKKNNGELINADSRQIYKYLDIITGKDLDYEKNIRLQAKQPSGLQFNIGNYDIRGVPIWLYDAVDPKIPFSSFDYKECALRVIDDIISRGKTPIIVGGTYLYLQHLLYGFETENIGPNWKLREELNSKSVEELTTILTTLDSRTYESMNSSDRKNPHRLIRRIEIVKSWDVIAKSKTTKQFHNGIATLSRQNGIARNDKKIIMIGLRYEKKEDLEKNIKKRVEKRLEQGAIQEVEELLKRGYTPKDPGLNSIGYKEIIDYLQGNLSKDEMVKRWVVSEMQYAKRQYVFMKKDKNITWEAV